MIDRDGRYFQATQCRISGCPERPILNGSCRLHWRMDRPHPPLVASPMIRIAAEDERFLMEVLARRNVVMQ